MSKTLRLGVAGAGMIGRTHIELIRASSECELAAIADLAPQAADYAAGLGAPYYCGLDAMLDAERPDGVIVATPNVMHAPNAIACLERNIPVLVEKPIADTLENAAEIVGASERTGVAVLAGHHRRHSPALERAREIVSSGQLGRIAAVAGFVLFLKPASYFDVSWRREPGGGPVLINLIHAIDDLRFVCGEIEALQAMTSSTLRGLPVEDSAVVTLRFASGALGTVTLSDKAAAPWSWELTAAENPAYPNVPEDCYLIAGTEGSLAVPSLRLWRHADERGWNSPLPMSRAGLVRADPLARQLAHFCAMLRGEAAPIATATDAMRTLAATYAVLDASRLTNTVRLKMPGQAGASSSPPGH